jgi:hypothetical protein
LLEFVDSSQNTSANSTLTLTMDFLEAHSISHANGQSTHYYEGGSKDGIPLVFIHGWPDLAETVSRVFT